MALPEDPHSGDQSPGSKPADTLDLLIAEARYHRQRFDLYRAKTYGLKPTSESRLRELQRSCESAEKRLAAARAARRAEPAGSSG